MSEHIGREATEYWQCRAVQAENVLDNLIQLLGYNFPHMQPDLGTLIDTWNKLILEVEDRHPSPNSCELPEKDDG